MDTIIGLLGLLISIAGFWLALWQLTRTHRAAEAARDAASAALERVSEIQTVTSLQDICSRSRDLLHLTRAKNIAAAANAAFELRDSLSRFRGAGRDMDGETTSKIERLLVSLSDVHDRLESSAITKRLDSLERELLIHEISKGHSMLSELVGDAVATGATNANS